MTTTNNWETNTRIDTVEGGFTVIWGLHLPGHHPAWSEYLLMLWDLGPRAGLGPAYLAKPGMTHEIMLCALDPATPIQRDAPMTAQRLTRLQPANHAYQFPAASNDEAIRRIQSLVAALVGDALSADTDFTPAWNELFKDGATLKESIFGASSATQN